MLTIHNMDNSGECRQDEFAYTGAHTADTLQIGLSVCTERHFSLKDPCLLGRTSWGGFCNSGQSIG